MDEKSTEIGEIKDQNNRKVKGTYVAMRDMRNAHARICRCKVIGSVTKNYIEMVYTILDYTKTVRFYQFCSNDSIKYNISSF